MRYLLSALCFNLLLVPTAVFGQEAGQKESAKKFVVPFEMLKTQHMVVNVKINGKGPFRLVFDTGAPDSLVSNKVAKEAGLFTKDFKKPVFALFGSMGQLKINELEIGDLKATNLSTMVLDHPTVQAISNIDGPLEGILGFTFYGRYRLSIDYQKKLMTFEPNEYQPGDVMQMMMKKMMAPKSVRDTPKVLSPAGILGIRVERLEKDEDAGVAVTEVLAESPAATAGFKTGDRLLTLDGRWTDTVADCFIAAGHIRVGTPVTAEILRDGKKIQLKLTLRAGL